MTGFASRLAAILARDGPISVEAFMAETNAYYYATRDPFGAAGDFTTAPEVSQMFGELVALFLAQSWRDQGAPAPVHLVEFGPGRGTLMHDMRRSLAQAAPDLAGAAQIHLIETSPVLRAAQETRLGPDIHWHAAFDTVPPGPILAVANEFFDALPICQFIRTDAGWAKRCIALDAHGDLAFVPGAPVALPQPAPVGTLIESCPVGQAIVRALAGRLVQYGGLALIIDYGHAQTAPGETLQAVKAHRYADPLATPGEADLTAHVDFEALARAALAVGGQPHGPVTQRAFLEALGLTVRAETLKRRASPAQAAEIESQRVRLTAPDQMGSLFKVMAITRPDSPRLAGF